MTPITVIEKNKPTILFHQTKSLLKPFIKALILLQLIIVYFFVLSFFSDATSFFDILYTNVILYLAFAFLLFTIIRTASKNYKSGTAKNKNFSEHTFTDDGITYVSDNTCRGVRAFTPYNKITKALFNKKALTIWTKRIVYFISRQDIDAETESALIRLFSEKLPANVFDPKKITKKKKDLSDPILLIPSAPKPFFLPQVGFSFTFDKAADNRAALISFTRKPKKVNFNRSFYIFASGFAFMFILSTILIIFDSYLSLSFFSQLTVLMTILFAEISLVCWNALKRNKKDPFFREGKRIDVAVNEHFLNYTIFDDEPQKETFYYSFENCTAIYESFEFFVINFVSALPIIINKANLNPSQTEALRAIFASKQNKYKYFAI